MSPEPKSETPKITPKRRLPKKKEPEMETVTALPLTIYCNNCGKEIDSSFTFCDQCGYRIVIPEQ